MIHHPADRSPHPTDPPIHRHHRTHRHKPTPADPIDATMSGPQPPPGDLPPPPPPPPGFWPPPPMPHGSGDRKRPYSSLYPPPPGMHPDDFPHGFPPPPPGMYPPPPPGVYPFPPPPPAQARPSKNHQGGSGSKGPARNRRTRGGTCQPCKSSKVSERSDWGPGVCVWGLALAGRRVVWAGLKMKCRVHVTHATFRPNELIEPQKHDTPTHHQHRSSATATAPSAAAARGWACAASPRRRPPGGRRAWTRRSMNRP